MPEGVDFLLETIADYETNPPELADLCLEREKTTLPGCHVTWSSIQCRNRF